MKAREKGPSMKRKNTRLTGDQHEKRRQEEEEIQEFIRFKKVATILNLTYTH